MTRALMIAVLLTAGGCGSSSRTVTETDLPEVPGPIAHSDYETFDVSRYPDSPVAAAIEFSHDVPEALLQNRADVGVEQTVSGYRVQVMATLDPDEADTAQAEVRLWWDRVSTRLPDGSGLATRMEVYRLFRQPYYRIRLGDLTQRRDAEELLNLVQSEYDGAFIVPDRVTIRK
jgi:SPOR domain